MLRVKKETENVFILQVVLVCSMFFAGFNYLPHFKISGVPIFQISVAVSILVAFLYKVNTLPNILEVKYYSWYLISSVPSLFIGVYHEGFLSLLVYCYTLFPFLLFRVTFDKIDKDFYHKLLFILCLSMMLVTIVGWLLRLSILPINTFFDVLDSEFLLGYWGIGYGESTRNHDYVYPLVGLAISLYFFTNKKAKTINLILILFFIITLIASLSRAAIIISIISIILLLRSTTKKVRFGVLSVFILVIFLNLNFIINEYENRFALIINSIFSTTNAGGQFSNESRMQIMKDALEASIVNPIGYGINNYSSIYSSDYSGHISKSGENAYLTILVERGWLAFILFLLIFINGVKKIFTKKIVDLNSFLVPFLAIYFLFNYELSNAFTCFIFYIIFLSLFFTTKETKFTKTLIHL